MSTKNEGLSRKEYLLIGGALGLFMGIVGSIGYPRATLVSTITITLFFSALMGGLFAAFKPRGVDGIIDWVLNFWR